MDLKGEVTEHLLFILITVKGINKKTGRPYERSGYLPYEAIPGICDLKLPAMFSE